MPASASWPNHYDSYAKKKDPNERTLCGHIDLSPRGSQPWQPAYGVAGAVQSKAADAAMASRMSLTAALGHSCGINFKAADHLREAPGVRVAEGLSARYAVAPVDHV
jgi:hypothetical protein